MPAKDALKVNDALKMIENVLRDGTELQKTQAANLLATNTPRWLLEMFQLLEARSMSRDKKIMAILKAAGIEVAPAAPAPAPAAEGVAPAEAPADNGERLTVSGARMGAEHAAVEDQVDAAIDALEKYKAANGGQSPPSDGEESGPAGGPGEAPGPAPDEAAMNASAAQQPWGKGPNA